MGKAGLRQTLRRPTAARGAPAHAVRRPEAAAGAPSPMHALQRSIGNRAVGRLLAARQAIQPRLKVGPVDNPLEREADRVADQVMRMPAPQLQRACCASCAVGGPCADELRREPARDGPVLPQGGTVEASLLAGLGSGKPLPPTERAFFEPRLGVDLARVRIHDGPAAGRAAASVDARAFALGRDVVLAAGAYRPGSIAGRRLLAHELVHVLQQSRGVPTPGQSEARSRSANHGAHDRAAPAPRSWHLRASPTAAPGVIQRACGAAEIGSMAGCERLVGDIHDVATSSQQLYRFNVGCDEFAPGERERLEQHAASRPASQAVVIHGFASEEGPAAFNDNLSCARAHAAKRVLLRQGVNTERIRALFQHGATPGDRPDRRSVVIAPSAETQAPLCGPDATGWFIAQVDAAKRDRTVLAIKSNLEVASRVAARYGFSAEAITEGAVLRKVLVEEERAGRPPRTPEATAQLAASLGRRRAFYGAVAAALPSSNPFAGRTMRVLRAIRRAALDWVNVVGTGRRYDFKNDRRTMRQPTSDSCPSGCPGTITLCPETNMDCFLTDVPGNLFYAHVGGFVGFTELALQLGSQFAQLESTMQWDPPEDTRMIHIGFNLPHPLTRSGFCAALAVNRSSFELRPCLNCPELVQAQVV